MHLERQKARCYKLAKQNSEEVVVMRNYFYDKMGILNLHIFLKAVAAQTLDRTIYSAGLHWMLGKK